MAAPKFLAPGEHVVFHVRAHWKKLVAPVLALLAVGALTWMALVWWVPDPETQAVWRWIIVGLAVVLVAIFSLWPFLTWLTTTDTLTTKRLISRDGVITRTGRDIPVDRVNAVNYERTLIDRIFGCGTLIVQTAGTESDVELHDVAHIERRLIQIQQILVDEQNEEDRRVRAIVAEEQRRTREGSPTTASRRNEPSSSPSDAPRDDAHVRDERVRVETASDDTGRDVRGREEKVHEEKVHEETVHEETVRSSAAPAPGTDAAPSVEDRDEPGGEPPVSAR